MNWETPWVVLRVKESGQASVVYACKTVKEGKYWLQYIAQPGDAMFQTPLHPKCAGTTEPTYFAHLIARGDIGHDRGSWEQSVLKGAGLVVESAHPAP
ncbi:MAG: hypothetical protein IT290_02300 [Deltaproteobacteria bacterium]|nr:hypothetical protein [Deltaproteobacteria bacterium]